MARARLLLRLLGLLGLAATARGQEPPTPLAAGVPIDREVPIGVAACFEIDAAQDEYVELSAERPFGALVLRLTDADGELLGEVAGTPAGGSSLRLACTARTSGPLQLEVTASDPETPRRGHFRLLLVEQRDAVPEDAERVAALAQLAAARVAAADATDDALRGEATRKLEEAATRLRKVGARADEAVAFEALNEVHYALGQTRELVVSADATLTAWRAAGDRREEGRALSRVGLAAYVAYDRGKSLASYRAALAIHEEVGDVEASARTLQRIGWYQRWSGDRRGAIEYYQRALPLCVQSHDWQAEISLYSDLGLASLELGDLATASRQLEHALELISPTRDVERLPSLLNVRAIVQIKAGEYEAGIETCRRGIAAALQVRNRRAEAALQNSLGNLYDELGDVAQARSCIERSLELSRAMGMSNGEASTLTFLSRLCYDFGDTAAANAHAEQALAVSREIRDPSAEAFSRQILGRLALERGDLPIAVAQFEAAIAQLRALDQRRGEASLLALLAEARARGGDREAGFAAANRAVELARETRDTELESRMLAWLAYSEREVGKRDASIAHARDAVRITESLRQRITQPDWRASYLATAQGRYEILIDALLAGDPASRGEHDVAEAFEASERARARSLLDLLAEAHIDVREGADPALVAQERELRRRLDGAASERRRVVGERPSEAQAVALDAQIDGLSMELRELEARMRVASPRFAALVRPEPATAAAVQSELVDDRTVLLELELGFDRSWLFVVTPTSLTAHALPRAAEIDALARSVRSAATSRQPRSGEPAAERRERVRVADELFARTAAELSALLLAPVAAQLGPAWSGARLVLVAPGALQELPFAALPEPGEGSPLIADHELILLPSASILAAIRRETAGRPPAERALALLADPVFDAADPRVTGAPRGAIAAAAAAPDRGAYQRLPFSREEARAIAAVVPGDSLLAATDFDANLARARGDELGRCRIVHFATHGVLDDQHPELSGLVLSLVDRDGRPQEGFLDLGDVYNLKLPADLVVLSACQTALGREVQGEGRVGLVRGFFYAGAARVVASLWQVDDLATAELMRRFYGGMFEQRLTPAAALRAAQAELARSERWRAPYFWAGFVLQGEWD